MNRETLSTIAFVILGLIFLDLMANDGRIIGGFINSSSTNVMAIDGQNLNNMVQQPQQVTAPIAATPATQFTVIDENSQPVLLAPPTINAQPPEAIIDWAAHLAAPTSTRPPLTDEKLTACIQAQAEGRRLAPYCPPNPANYAGTGR